MFEKKFTPTAGQTVFTLDAAGPFAASQVIYRPVREWEADEGQTEFPLGYTPSYIGDPTNFALMVRVDGELTWDWSVDGQNLVLNPAPTEGAEVTCVDNYNWFYPVLENAGFTLSGVTLTWIGQTLVAGDLITVQSIFAPIRFSASIAEQVAFVDASGVIAKNAGFVSVFVDGVQKRPDVVGQQRDYSITASTITFHTAPGVGKMVVALFGDFDVIREAYNKAQDGDRIELSEVDLSTQAGVAKQWMYRRMMGAGAERIVNFTTPTATYDINAIMLDGMLANQQANQSLSISKGVTFCKKTTGAKPTVVEYLTNEEWEEYLPNSEQADGFSQFLIAGNVSASSTKRPKFEDIQFHRFSRPILGLSPFILDRCAFDRNFEPVMTCLDNRMTFPHLVQNGHAFQDMLTTEITNCTFTNTAFAPITGQGSGAVISHNSFSEYKGAFAYIAWRAASAGDMLWFQNAVMFYGTPEDALLMNYCVFNALDDNDFDGTGSERNDVVTFVGEAFGKGAEAYNNATVNNRFLNMENSAWCAEAGYAGGGGVAQDNEVSGNTFTKCSGGVVVISADSVTKPNNSLISDNTFIDCDEATSIFWPRDPEGLVPGHGPALWLLGARFASVAGNDYTQSGLVPVAEAELDQDVPIEMVECDHCTISEKSSAFPNPSLPVDNWVMDVDGFQNWIGKRYLPQRWNRVKTDMSRSLAAHNPPKKGDRKNYRPKKPIL